MANIPNNYDILNYTAVAGQTVFTITWPYQTEETVYFTINGDDSERIAGNYTLTPAGDLNGGTLTLDTPLNEDDKVVIYRNDLPEQLVLFLNNAKLTGSMIETENNNIFYILQSLKENYLDLTDVDKVVNFINEVVIPTIPDASTSEKGLTQLATEAEALAKTNNTKAMTPETVGKVVENELDNVNEATTEARNLSKSLSGNGVVSGLALRNDAGVLKIETGYGYASESRRLGKKPSDITVYPVELTTETEINSFPTDGIKHIYLVNGTAPYYQDTIAEPPTNIHIYLGYVLVEGGLVTKVFSKPNVLANPTERLNLKLQRDTKFENLEVNLDTLVFDRGVILSGGYNIESNACNYNGELGNTTYADIDRIENGLGSSVFWEVGFETDGTTEEIISSSSSNVNQTELINKINDASSSLSHKTLTNEFTNLRILLSSKGQLAIQRGQYDYADVDSALEAITNEDYTLIPSFSDFTPIYALTVQAGVTTFADAVLTRLYDVGGATNGAISDWVAGSPVTATLELHPDIATQYPELIEQAGQQNILVTQYPELAAFSEYIADTFTDNLINDGTSFNTTNDTDISFGVSSCRIGNTVYYGHISNASTIYKIFDTDNVVNNTGVSLFGTSNMAIIPKNGTSTEVLVYYANKTQRFNLTTGAAIDASISQFDSFTAGNYNNNLGKYIIFGTVGASLQVKSTVDNFLYTTEFSNSTFGKGAQSATSTGGNDFYENGDANYLNGKYYIVTQNSNILQFDENDLANPVLVYTYTGSGGLPKKARVIDNLIIVSRGYNTSTKTAEFTYSTDGTTWTDFDIVLPETTTNVLYDFFIVDTETLLINISESSIWLIKDFKNSPTVAQIELNTNSKIGGGMINLSNGNIMRPSSRSLSGADGISIDRYTKTTSGGNTFNIPDRTSENDSKGRYKVYLNAGKPA